MRSSSDLLNLWLPLSLSILWWAAAPQAHAAELGAAPKPTLAAALAQAAPPSAGLALSVDAERIALPGAETSPGATIAEVAGDYGRTSQSFHDVAAIAPPMMVVLNTAPGEPNIYAGMPPIDAFTLLTSTLTDSQWEEMTSEKGLAVTSFNPTQKQIFASLISANGKLMIQPQYANGEKWDDHDKRDITEQLPLIHLRMSQTITLNFPPKDDPNSSYMDAEIPPPAGAPRRYAIADRQDFGGSSDTDYGAAVRAEIPNVPKRGQLDFSITALQTAIPVDGLKTVGDLVYRIGNLTKTELYVDPRLEKKTLTIVGAQAAPAADLLRALAFCLTGAYRQVGPAYVLTDDIVGLGTRRQIWEEFEREADILRRGPVRAAGSALYTRHSPRDLPWLGDPAAVTPEELALADPNQAPFSGKLAPELQLTLSQMTPAQQDMARRGVEKWNKDYKLQPVTSDGKITIRPGLSIQLLAPGVDTPIDLNLNHGGMEQLFLFQPPPYVPPAPPARPALKLPDKAPMADVWAALKTVPRRAAIIHPRNAKEADDAVEAAKTLGVTELWLDVFSEGVSHIPVPGVKRSSHDDNDILTEALARSKGTSIKILPFISITFWGDRPPAEAADRNILGETSAQAAARWRQLKTLLPAGETMGDENYLNAVVPDWPGVIVCPLAPAVRTTLSTLIASLAARSGVAGMVWRDLDSPGYGLLPGGSDTSSLLMGYHEAARLAFLRRFHADPVDIYDVGHYGTKANTDLPLFGDSREEYRLHDSWVKFRQDAEPAFLRDLYAAANPPGTPPARRIPILVKQLRQGQAMTFSDGHTEYPPGWYGSWDDPALPPPTLHKQGEEDKPGEPPKNVPSEADQAKMQSHVVMTPLTFSMLEQMRYMESARKAAGAGRPFPAQSKMSSFVLDPGDRPGVSALTELAAQVVSGVKAAAR